MRSAPVGRLTTRLAGLYRWLTENEKGREWVARRVRDLNRGNLHFIKFFLPYARRVRRIKNIGGLAGLGPAIWMKYCLLEIRQHPDLQDRDCPELLDLFTVLDEVPY